MKATTQLLTALVLGAVSGVESAIPDPVLAAGTGHLYPGSDTTTDTWREDNTLLVVGAFEWTDANVFTEALRVASAYFTWRDHINSLGGICLSGSSYDTSCTDRVKARAAAAERGAALTSAVAATCTPASALATPRLFHASLPRPPSPRWCSSCIISSSKRRRSTDRRGHSSRARPWR